MNHDNTQALNTRIFHILLSFLELVFLYRLELNCISPGSFIGLSALEAAEPARRTTLSFHARSSGP